MDDVRLEFDPLPGEALTHFVSENIFNVDVARTGVSAWQPVGFFLKSTRGEVLGGLTGFIWGGWLHVHLLWVTEVVRGKGLGTRLMDAAEGMALEHGATGANLETFSFQAVDFYRRRGYEVFGQIDDWPPGHSKFYLRKTLRAALS